jgi:hypothetical protein
VDTGSATANSAQANSAQAKQTGTVTKSDIDLDSHTFV